MGKTLVGNKSIRFDYIIEVEGYQRPLLLLQFSLDASMTMCYKTSGKSSRLDHLTDTRRCSIWYEKDFNREVKITTLFGGENPQITYSGSIALPILSAGIQVAFEGILEEMCAWITNIFEKGHCGSSKGRRRRNEALGKYRTAFNEAVDQSINEITNTLGNEAAKSISAQIRGNNGSKIVVKRVIPRAIPNYNNISKKNIATQIHKSITGNQPNNEEIALLLNQQDTQAIIKVSSDIHVENFLKIKQEIQDYFEPLNAHAKKVAYLIDSGGERRAPEVEFIFGESAETRQARQVFSDLVNGLSCSSNALGGFMSSLYFPDNIELSKEVDREFKAYEDLKIKITDWIQEGRNITRILTVLHQDPTELEEILDDIEEKLEPSDKNVITFLLFKHRVRECRSIKPNRPLYRHRRIDLLGVLEDARELVLPATMDEEIIHNPRIFDYFEDYLPPEIELNESDDISIHDFLGSIPALNKLDKNKLHIIKSELELIRSNKMFDSDIRESAFKLEDQMNTTLGPAQLEKVDLEIRSLANKISAINTKY